MVKIRELEEENEKLKEQVEILKGKLYEKCEYTIYLYYDVI
ncbi:hypothetical protein [Clostridium amylolyticum]|nr:hypothetical protein [Clostridium amylolyticum]